MLSIGITVPATIDVLGTAVGLTGFQYNQSISIQLPATAGDLDAVAFYGGNISNATNVNQLIPLGQLGIPAPGETGKQPSMSFGATFLYLYAVRKGISTVGALVGVVAGQETAGTSGGATNPNGILQGGNSFGAPIAIGALDNQTVTVGGLSAGSATTITSGAGQNTTISATGAGAVNISAGTGTSSWLIGAGGTLNVATDANAHTVNVATGAAAQTLTAGSTNTTSTTRINSGSGGIGIGVAAPGSSGIAIDTPAAGTIAVGATNATLLTLATNGVTQFTAGAGGVQTQGGGAGGYSIGAGVAAPATIANTFALAVAAAGTINIATTATAAVVNLGTGAAAILATLGSQTAASGTTINGGTTGITIAIPAAANAGVQIQGGIGSSSFQVGAAGTLNLATNPVAATVNLGTGAAAQTVTVGSTTTTSGTVVQSGTGSTAIKSTGAGNVTLSPGLTGNVQLNAVGGTATCGVQLGVPVAVTDKAGGGTIGANTITVDIASVIEVNQTTAAQTLTVPNPTVTTQARLLYIINIGSVDFTLLGSTVKAIGAGSKSMTCLIWSPGATRWVPTVIT